MTQNSERDQGQTRDSGIPGDTSQGLAPCPSLHPPIHPPVRHDPQDIRFKKLAMQEGVSSVCVCMFTES